MLAAPRTVNVAAKDKYCELLTGVPFFQHPKVINVIEVLGTPRSVAVFHETTHCILTHEKRHSQYHILLAIVTLVAISKWILRT